MLPELRLVVVESDSRKVVAAQKVDRKASKALGAAVKNRPYICHLYTIFIRASGESHKS